MSAVVSPRKRPVLHVPIGPSGSGKSTLFKKLNAENPSLEAFSWDTLRVEWYYPTDYAKAWELACKDKQFYPKALAVYKGMINDGKDVYLDNTNLTPKNRVPFIDIARQAGYTVIAHLFDVNVDTLLERQKTRPDKNVPENAVRQQVKSLVIPTLLEVDEVLKV